MSTLSLEASKKVFEIVGEYETEKKYAVSKEDDFFVHAVSPRKPFYDPRLCWSDAHGDALNNPEDFNFVPRPNFAELIRVLPKMQKTTGNNEEWASAWCRINATAMVLAYMQAPTEQEGLRAVEKILMEIK